MYNKQIQVKLQEIVKNTTKTGIYSKIKGNKDCFIYIQDFISQNNLKFNEGLFLIINNLNITSLQCPICKIKRRAFNSLFKGFYLTCGKKCSHNSKERYEVTKRKNIEKYGVEHPMMLQTTKEKIKETCQKRYGVEHSSKSELVKRKREVTSLKKYGVKYPHQTIEVQEKKKKNTLSKYGVEYTSQLLEKKEKTKETCLLKYGFKTHLIDPIFIKKNTHENLKRNYERALMDLKGKYTHTITFEEYSRKKSKGSYMFSCNTCGTSFISPLRVSLREGSLKYGPKCPVCLKTRISYPEQELYNYIREILGDDLEIIKNSRRVIKPLELDIYIPQYKLAIEYDGLMFHSVGSHSHPKFNNTELNLKNYHFNKTKLCQEKGIRLLHIFENEWLDPTKKEVWKSIIREILVPKSTVNISYSFCEISLEQGKLFLQLNTPDTNINEITKAIGIFNGLELIGVFGLNLTTIVEFIVTSGNYESILIQYNKSKIGEISHSLMLDLRFHKFYDYLLLGYKQEDLLEPVPFYFSENKNIHILTRDKKEDSNRRIYNCGYLLYK